MDSIEKARREVKHMIFLLDNYEGVISEGSCCLIFETVETLNRLLMNDLINEDG